MFYMKGKFFDAGSFVTPKLDENGKTIVGFDDRGTLCCDNTQNLVALLNDKVVFNIPPYAINQSDMSEWHSRYNAKAEIYCDRAYTNFYEGFAISNSMNSVKTDGRFCSQNKTSFDDGKYIDPLFTKALFKDEYFLNGDFNYREFILEYSSFKEALDNLHEHIPLFMHYSKIYETLKQKDNYNTIITFCVQGFDIISLVRLRDSDSAKAVIGFHANVSDEFSYRDNVSLYALICSGFSKDEARKLIVDKKAEIKGIKAAAQAKSEQEINDKQNVTHSKLDTTAGSELGKKQYAYDSDNSPKDSNKDNIMSMGGYSACAYKFSDFSVSDGLVPNSLCDKLPYLKELLLAFNVKYKAYLASLSESDKTVYQRDITHSKLAKNFETWVNGGGFVPPQNLSEASEYIAHLHQIHIKVLSWDEKKAVIELLTGAPDVVGACPILKDTNHIYRYAPPKDIHSMGLEQNRVFAFKVEGNNLIFYYPPKNTIDILIDFIGARIEKERIGEIATFGTDVAKPLAPLFEPKHRADYITTLNGEGIFAGKDNFKFSLSKAFIKGYHFGARRAERINW